MKMIIVAALALVAIASAAPAGPTSEPAVIVSADFDQQPDGSYKSSFETSDGTKREEEGVLKEALDEENKPHSVVVVRGSFTYLDEEGKPQTITYFADETGYHAEGDAIPKEPVARR